MQRARGQLTAGQIAELHEQIGRKLDTVGIETQPEVAMKILALVQNPDAQIAEYARTIRADQAISGRLLKLANSAFYGQRQPVTNLERACVLLGTTRLRTLSLGCFMARAATGDPRAVASRQVWTASVFRACLAQALAARLAPEARVEAFIVGLMLDAGIPLLHRMVGEPALKLFEQHTRPAALFLEETKSLAYNHVDVVTAVINRWHLPRTLALPIQWHHVPPSEKLAINSDSLVHRLHRIAFYAGAIEFDRTSARPVVHRGQRPGPPGAGADPGERLAALRLGLPAEVIESIVQAACAEYASVCEVFGHVADRFDNLDELGAIVHARLADAMDEHLTLQNATPAGDQARCEFEVAGTKLEILSDPGHGAIAYLVGSAGERIASFRFDPCVENAASVCFSLGLDIEEKAAKEPAVLRLDDHIRRLAA